MTSSILDLADLVAVAPSIQPDGRRAAIAATFRQQAALCTDRCMAAGYAWPDLPDLMAAFAALGEPREGDEGAVISRRTTLREIVAAVGCAETGDAAMAEPWFTATALAFFDSEDPRQIAMRETAARELAELIP